MHARDKEILDRVDQKLNDAFRELGIIVTRDEVKEAALVACKSLWSNFGEI